MSVILLDKGPVLMGKVVTSYSYLGFDLTAANLVKFALNTIPFQIFLLAAPL